MWEKALNSPYKMLSEHPNIISHYKYAEVNVSSTLHAPPAHEPAGRHGSWNLHTLWQTGKLALGDALAVSTKHKHIRAQIGTRFNFQNPKTVHQQQSRWMRWRELGPGPSEG